MKKFLVSAAVAAMILPSVAFAQEAETQMNDTMGTTQTDTGTMGASPGGAMGAGAASSTADTTGSYTIVTKTLAENDGTDTGLEGNRNTDPAAIQRTIDANPGLAEKLQAEGVMTDEIGSISVGPNGEVTIFSKS